MNKCSTLLSPYLASVIFIILLTNQVKGDSMLNWFWGKSREEAPVAVSNGVPLVNIPYEQLTEDEKFLKEAAKFVTDIQISSPLEVCQHKVILKIKTSCSSMTEEQLAKLSVNLLNCQSENEGRKTYPCTDEMTIKQCTSNMDADTWNAYHLMSNRARAVCYAARSHQFRALTELTVNKLMQSAHSQIEKLAHLKESQDRLEEQTITAQKIVETNIQELTEEKALIKAGHIQLASMTEDIKKKLENASQELLEQATEQSLNHQEILKDLEKIQIQAQKLWESANRIIEQNHNAAKKYQETLKKLEKINETILYIWDLTNKMRSEIDEKLGWITEYIGNTGENLEKAYRSILHVVYLFGAMVFASFLQAPFITRSAILGVVPLNLLSYLKHGLSASLDFISLTVLIIIITAMHYVMNGIHYMMRSKDQNSYGQKKQKKRTYSTNETVPEGNEQSHKYTKHSSGQKQHLSIFSRINYKIIHFWNSFIHQIYHSLTVFATMKHWVWWNLISSEELSCSYLPARKYENITNKGYASISEDSSDYSDLFDNGKLIHDDNSVTGTVLRHVNTEKKSNPLTAVLKRNVEPRIRESIHSRHSEIRGCSPASAITPVPRAPCAARTRSGNPCRLMPVKGQNFCHKHTSGSSYTDG
ncbi:protein brambleberry-like isoform X2 [Copidosoma floridanum]|uniref:protein brambleberry-like isoform X2 n=1 Tax=Copidosoma floridanum TaxID=29053 RepID=UPI000C6F8EDE|nr:protein brambleberry-like isoform X2 [Copidosoma floridanum]